MKVHVVRASADRPGAAWGGDRLPQTKIFCGRRLGTRGPTANRACCRHNIPDLCRGTCTAAPLHGAERTRFAALAVRREGMRRRPASAALFCGMTERKLAADGTGSGGGAAPRHGQPPAGALTRQPSQHVRRPGPDQGSPAWRTVLTTTARAGCWRRRWSRKSIRCSIARRPMAIDQTLVMERAAGWAGFAFYPTVPRGLSGHVEPTRLEALAEVRMISHAGARPRSGVRRAGFSWPVAAEAAAELPCRNCGRCVCLLPAPALRDYLVATRRPMR